MKKILYPNLAAEMGRHGEVQSSLVKVLDLTQQSISRKLSGKSEWTIGEIEKLCEHYNKDYCELFKKNSE